MYIDFSLKKISIIDKVQKICELELRRTMSKAEKFIQEYTRNCSNEYLGEGKSDGHGETISKKNFTPWLTPDQARKAVEIAREEIMEKVVEFLSKEKNIPLWDDNSGNFGCDNSLLIKNLKQVIKDE